MTRTLIVVGAVFLAGCHDIASPSMPTPVSQDGASLIVSAQPLSLGGSTTTVTARVLNSINGATRDRLVRFSTSAGTLSTPTAMTDSDGRARVTLTGSSSATVTATVDAAPPQTFTVEAVQPFTLTMDVAPNPLQWQTTVTVTAINGFLDRPSAVEVDCGNGQVITREGFLGSDVFTCRATQNGTYLTTARARTANGWSVAAQMPITLSWTPAPPPPFTVRLDVVGPDPDRGVSFSVIVTADQRVADTYDFDFGDGNRTGPINTWHQLHYYAQSGTYHPNVTVRTVDGRSERKTATVVVP